MQTAATTKLCASVQPLLHITQNWRLVSQTHAGLPGKIGRYKREDLIGKYVLQRTWSRHLVSSCSRGQRLVSLRNHRRSPSRFSSNDGVIKQLCVVVEVLPPAREPKRNHLLACRRYTIFSARYMTPVDSPILAFQTVAWARKGVVTQRTVFGCGIALNVPLVHVVRPRERVLEAPSPVICASFF
jgi:hypothetical protein